MPASRNKRRIFIIVISVFLIAGAVYLFFGDQIFSNDGFSAANQETYASFYKCVENQTVEKVKISEDKIEYWLKDSDVKYVTQNPESPSLKETLLKNNVQVESSKSSSQIISFISDMIFYIFIAAILILAFKKVFSPTAFKVQHKTGKKFSDVVGMDSLKSDMKQIMNIMHNPKEWARKGIRMPKGILLEGAPGNGKTLFAKALAGEANVNFIPTKATDFESMFMAIGPMKVKSLFRKARRHAPCIIFIDEFDGIGTRRNYAGSAIETENTRIVTALLNELDGFEPASGVLVLAATNSIHALDEALIRPGRFDARFTVPYPNKENIKQLVKMYTKGKSFAPECTVEKIADLFSGYSCAKIESVLNRASLIAIQKNKPSADLQDISDAIKEQESAK